MVSIVCISMLLTMLKLQIDFMIHFIQFSLWKVHYV